MLSHAWDNLPRHFVDDGLWPVSGTPVKSPVSKPEIFCNRRLITRLIETRFCTTSLVKLTGDQLTLDFDLRLVDDATWRLAIG